MKKYKKLSYEKCKDEKFVRKEYFFLLNLDDVRTRFRAEYFMIKTVKKNYPRRYRNKSLLCQSCTSLLSEFNSAGRPNKPPEDSQSHLTQECLAFVDLREKYDIETDQGIVDFFRE